MNVYKKHISILLLLAFYWLSVPASLTHNLFADHEDTHCELGHEGTTIEMPHTHCEVFKVQSPVYQVPEFVVLECPVPALVSVVNSYLSPFHKKDHHFNLPARAPPFSGFF
ncbi:MAG: hypothetical protein JNL60_16305 [Bacteroidia bacterium]|nr:hypothetical protein [Bacteroidia bacterium]